jgi:SanA protein
LFVFTLFSNLWVIFSTRDQVYQGIENIPANDVALVLGTSKKQVGGKANPFFTYRIEAAAELYKSGKVKLFILSGDNRTKYYNEPADMKKALVALGVPETAIVLDYAGLRTLDSVVRSKMVFGFDEITIITQKFHSYRAVFICRHYNIKANAFAAKNPPLRGSFKVLIREIFARPKAVIDLYILNIEPEINGVD